MIELLPYVLKALLKGQKPTYKTETFTQTSGSVTDLRNWKNAQGQGMIDRAAVKPTVHTLPSNLKPVNSPVTPVSGMEPIGITGGPPMTTTRTTVTYKVK